MARKSFLGHKIRRLRLEQDLSQVQMAERLGISPSYLNLIEHNQRPLTLPLVLKVSRLFEMDLQTFSDEEEVRLVADLDEMFGDPVFRDNRPQPGEVEELVGGYPETGRAIAALYRAYRNASDDVHLLRERVSGDTFLSASSHQLLTVLTSVRSFAEILHDNADLKPADRDKFLGIILEESERLSVMVGEMLEYGQGEGTQGLPGGATPAEDVADFIEDHDNFFPEIEAAAAALRDNAKLGPVGPGDGLVESLARKLGIELEWASADALGGRPSRFDSGAKHLVLSEALVPASVRFEVARRAAFVAADKVLARCLVDGGVTTRQTQAPGREALARYFAAAVVLPYEPMLEAAESLRYDLELLAQRFGASYEQICQRLTALRRPGAAGVPFHFVRVDIAGNISKRFGGAGLRIPRFGGACPRWAVHAAFLAPGAICTQIEALPDGSRYLSLGRSLVKTGGGHNRPKSHLAVGIGCDLSYASRVVYADSLNLDDLAADVPIGITCRLCERDDCGQRAFPRVIQSPAAVAAE